MGQNMEPHNGRQDKTPIFCKQMFEKYPSDMLAKQNVK